MIDQSVRSQNGGEMKLAFEDPHARAEDRSTIFGKALDYLLDGGHSLRRPPRALRDAPFAVLRKAVSVLIGTHPFVTGEYDTAKLDELLLKEALSRAGFTAVQSCGSAESRIPRWAEWDLDRAPDGNEIEPSLYLEASKG